MSMSVPYPVQLEFQADTQVTRVAPAGAMAARHSAPPDFHALRALRQLLTLISFFTVLFTEQIPRSLFDAIVMTYRYEWRAMSYALFLPPGFPAVRLRAVVRGRRGRAAHDARLELSRLPQAVEAVRIAAQHHIPVVTRGGASNCSAGMMPNPDRVMIDLSTMNGIFDIDATTRTARVQPGVINADLQQQLAPTGCASRPTRYLPT